jgi:hypothetical protein
MKMWIARAESGNLKLYQTEPQQEVSMLTGGIYWNDRLESFKIDDRLFPEVTFENSPMEVELKIKKNGLHFSPMFRLLGMIINKDPSDRKRIVGYTKKLIDNLKEEGFDADARVAEDYLKAFNGEQVGMATMDDVELKLI